MRATVYVRACGSSCVCVNVFAWRRETVFYKIRGLGVGVCQSVNVVYVCQYQILCLSASRVYVFVEVYVSVSCVCVLVGIAKFLSEGWWMSKEDVTGGNMERPTMNEKNE